MGQTTKVLKQEVKNIYSSVLNELTENEKMLTSYEKRELRLFIYQLNEASIHSFSHIFIRRKIKEILNRRTETPTELESIDDLNDDKIKSLMEKDLIKLAKEIGIEKSIEILSQENSI